MNVNDKVYPLKAIRALALHTQGLAGQHRRRGKPSVEDVYTAVERVGWVQIDTLQVVNRSQYIALWSRLGDYDMAHLDQLLFDGGSMSPDNRRRLFEYWAHAACIIPLTSYPWLTPMMKRRATERGTWHRKWVSDPENARFVESLFERIRSDGPARPADFRTGKRAPGSWWNWDDAKIALEHLYDVGSLAISNRINFQRIYDASERVIPQWVDRNEPTAEEALKRLLEISLRSLGACEPVQVGDYFHMKRTEAKPLVASLVSDGTFVRINGKLADGATRELLVHRENMPVLEKAADGEIRAGRTTFLSPFDSLFWAKGRDMDVWKFNQTLECYVPEPKRRWGYFCLPILYGDRLVGRFDPKIERKTGVMRLKKLHLEPGVKPGAGLASGVSRAMRDFMKFHKAADLVIEHSDPKEFGDRLTATL